MRNRFDQLAKQALQALLAPAGPVETDTEVSPEAQHIDLWFTPAPACASALAPLGLLGRLAARPCAIEAFHCTPRPEELDGCHRKHVNFCHALALRTPPQPPPMQWVLSSGRPSSGLKGYGCRHARGWPRGIYVAPPRIRLGIVSIRELPVARDTLLLRLLGAGPVLRRAIRELRELPPEAPERRVVLPILLRLRLEVQADVDKQTNEDRDEDREFLMSTQDALELWERQVEERATERALQRGLAPARHGLVVLYQSRFGAVPAVVRARIDAMSDPDTLHGWYDLVASGTREEVDRALTAG